MEINLKYFKQEKLKKHFFTAFPIFQSFLHQNKVKNKI
jgi:hypothetical protein